MKCPYCNEDLPANICINPSCSAYGQDVTINNFSENINTKNDSNIIQPLNQKQNNFDSNHFSAKNNITDEEFINFVGEKKSDYYLEYFRRYKDNSRFASWNWSSFFLSGYWLLYRKLYLLFFGLILLNACTNFAPIEISLFLSIIIAFLIGIYGNNLYIRIVESKIRKIKSNFLTLNRDEYFELLRSKGGTSLIGPFIILGINIIGIYIVKSFI